MFFFFILELLVAIWLTGETIWKSEITQDMADFVQKMFLYFFVFDLLVYLQKELHSYLLLVFHNCSTNVQRNVKENRKRVITLQINTFFKILRKSFLDSHMRNYVKVSKLQIDQCGFNRLKPHTHVPHILLNLGTVKLKKKKKKKKKKDCDDWKLKDLRL